MKKKKPYASLALLAVFALWTMALCVLDVRPIGPMGSSVGLASVNGFVHKLTGVHMTLYHITDWAGLVPIFVAMGFGFLGLTQWIKRKKLCKVDHSLLVLGGFYLTVIAIYGFFETATVNYRPVLIEGVLETSYPSSTTLLVLCVMPTAVLQLRSRIRNAALRTWLSRTLTAFSVLAVVGRLISGVHWVTDIVGGILLSAGLVRMYQYFVSVKE